MDFKNKLLKYETKIFKDYLQKRKLFINTIKNIDFNEFNNNGFINFVSDTKMIIDSLKNNIQNINHFLMNEKKNFKSNESVVYNKDIEYITILYYNYFKINQSESGSESVVISSNFLDNSEIYSESTVETVESESSDSESDSE